MCDNAHCESKMGGSRVLNAFYDFEIRLFCSPLPYADIRNFTLNEQQLMLESDENSHGFFCAYHDLIGRVIHTDSLTSPRRFATRWRTLTRQGQKNKTGFQSLDFLPVFDRKCSQTRSVPSTKVQSTVLVLCLFSIFRVYAPKLWTVLFHKVPISLAIWTFFHLSFSPWPKEQPESTHPPQVKLMIFALSAHLRTSPSGHSARSAALLSAGEGACCGGSLGALSWILLCSKMHSS